VKALVTGAGGFVGSCVVDELLRRGADVTGIVRPSGASARRLEDRGVAILGADLRRPPADLAERVAGFDVLLHLASGVAGNWRATFDNNVTATENLVEALRGANWRGRFVHVSSFSVYGLNQLPRGSVVDESTPLEPRPGKRDDYAWTKLLQERVVRRLESGPAELVVVRPGAIYGPERRFQYRLGRPLGERSVLLLGGLVPMPLNYVENTASLLVECAGHPAATGEVFNAVDPEPLTQLRYLREWRARADGPAVLPFPLTALRAIGAVLERAADHTDGRVAPPPFLDPYVMGPSFKRLRYDSSRAASVLGWSPPVSTPEALERTFGPKSD